MNMKNHVLTLLGLCLALLSCNPDRKLTDYVDPSIGTLRG